MFKKSSQANALITAVIAFCMLAGTAHAQLVALGDGIIEIIDFDGDVVMRVSNAANYVAGGSGRTGDITLRQADGSTTFHTNSGTGTLTLGGGADSGDLILRDSDGTTTTVNLEGRLGLITLGAPGSEDGDIIIYDGNTTLESFRVDGNTGNATNQFGGNGLVKAWARINSDGTIASCYRCNTDTTETRRISEGHYEVDFTSISTLMRLRPFLCSLGYGEVQIIGAGHIICSRRNGDQSSINIVTTSDSNTAADGPFTVVVF